MCCETDNTSHGILTDSSSSPKNLELSRSRCFRIITDQTQNIALSKYQNKRLTVRLHIKTGLIVTRVFVVTASAMWTYQGHDSLLLTRQMRLKSA